MQIWYVSDGKAGHMSQARGLFKALQAQHPNVQVLEIPVIQLSSLALLLHWLSGGKLGQLPQLIQDTTSPDLILGVGHTTHWPLLLLQKIYKQTKSIVLMQPSLPDRWFDFLVIPEHDAPKTSPDLFISKGVLNPVQDEQRHVAGRTLILIGGSSKRHGWNDSQLIAQLHGLFHYSTDQHFILTTSRRTPHDFLQQLGAISTPDTLQVYPVDETPQGWLFEQLQQAETVWVTEDSVSMLYEALSAGCRVGILAMPRLRQDRITSSVDQLLQSGQVLSLAAFLAGEKFKPVKTLHEAGRVVHWLLEKLHLRAVGE